MNRRADGGGGHIRIYLPDFTLYFADMEHAGEAGDDGSDNG